MNQVTREEFLGTTQAKSDQINAADLLGGPLVGQITAIQMTGAADQPVSIRIDSHPQPWKPSKTSRRVLAACWSDVEPSEWIGRWVVLYCDESVKWAGVAAGGIRTSHLSHISGKKTIMVNETRGKKAAQIVEPYYPENAPKPEPEQAWYPQDKFETNLAAWIALIDEGKKTAEQIIASVERGGKLTAGQKARIKPTPAQTDDKADDLEPPPYMGDEPPFD